MINFQRLASLAGVACLVMVMEAKGWTTSGSPLFQPVHQIAIENVLKNKLTDTEIQRLKDQQVTADKDQQPVQSHEHAMTGIEDSTQTYAVQKAIYIRKTEQYLAENLTNAVAGRGRSPAAMEFLGRVIHALQDAVSPSHERFQAWRYDEHAASMYAHVNKERVYPTGMYRSRLEGAVRWAYDIYLERAPMPQQFFDSTGWLLLPAEYQ
jgi:hypothetical protein